MTPRLRRLISDFQALSRDFNGHPQIAVVPIEGDPPERYRVEYRLTGLVINTTENRIERRDFHEIELYLSADYPRVKPTATPITPVFHPNIRRVVCIGDHWAAGETLSDVVIKIGHMIQFLDYNLASPLDMAAARWAKSYANLLPVGKIHLCPAALETPSNSVVITRTDTVLSVDVDREQNDDDITLGPLKKR